MVCWQDRKTKSVSIIKCRHNLVLRTCNVASDIHIMKRRWAIVRIFPFRSIGLGHRSQDSH